MFGRKPLHLRKFGPVQRAIQMEGYQGRMFWRVCHLVDLLHYAPSREVPQYRRGKQQGIDAVEHTAVARKNRA